MNPTTCELTGVIRGQTIELTTPPGLPDGEEVRVVLVPRPAAKKWGEGIRRSAGCGSGDEAFGAAMDQIYRDRKQDRPLPNLRVE